MKVDRNIPYLLSRNQHVLDLDHHLEFVGESACPCHTNSSPHPLVWELLGLLSEKKSMQLHLFIVIMPLMHAPVRALRGLSKE